MYLSEISIRFHKKYLHLLLLKNVFLIIVFMGQFANKSFIDEMVVNMICFREFSPQLYFIVYLLIFD